MVVTTLSGYTEFHVVEIANGVKISGEVVKISGEKIYVITKSGDTVNQGSITDPIRHMFGYDYIDTARFLKVGTDARLLVNISGETVIAKVSGEVVKISGEVVKISGETVIATISGEVVKISGEVVKISGDVIKTIAAEDDYDFQSYDLGDARSGTALDLTGSSLTIWELDGTCEIKFNSTSKPAIPIAAIPWPAMITFERKFTNVYLTNTSQASKTLKTYMGKMT